MNRTIKSEVISHLKKFKWQEIIDKGNLLEDLNDRQWRFMKGLVIELIVEKNSGRDGLKYVGKDHKDYDWPKYGISVELKSGLSGSMYGKRGNLNKSFNIKFNNSNGTNNKEKLDPDQVADMLLVVKNDGAFVVDKETVILKSKKSGDGFDIILGRGDITEITGKMTPGINQTLNIKQRIQDAIRQAI